MEMMELTAVIFEIFKTNVDFWTDIMFYRKISSFAIAIPVYNEMMMMMICLFESQIIRCNV